MEQLGDVFEGEWASWSTEESEFMTQLLDGECLGFFAGQLNFWPAQTSSNVASTVDEDSFVYTSDPSTSNVCLSPQETSTYSGSHGDGDINFLLSSSNGTLYQLGDSDQSFATNDLSCYYNSVDFSFGEEEDMSVTDQVCTDLIMLEDEGSTLLKNISTFGAEVGENISNSVALHGTKLETQVLDNAADEKVTRKRPHNAEAQKKKRNVKPRKSKKVAEITNVDESKSGCGVLLTQTSSSNCLKNDASAEEFSNLTAEDSPPPGGKGKTRADRGSATDPQSLYARKRREKINERLRILQGLVPNGTKVDISTMLDEAVQYVKFLQLQIKLLSSDDTWMYAPLAYNGMDLGLDLKM